MPMYPEIIEVIPPTIKAAVVKPLGMFSSSNSAVKKIRVPNKIRNMSKNRYSCLKKVEAPYTQSKIVMLSNGHLHFE